MWIMIPGAEHALEQTYGRLILRDSNIWVSWTKSYVPTKVLTIHSSSIPRPKDDPPQIDEDQSKSNNILKKLLNPGKNWSTIQMMKMQEFNDFIFVRESKIPPIYTPPPHHPHPTPTPYTQIIIN